ncbi:uncharacterized protein LOC128921431 [Zeugodacus cucurbitae]|uniref:uncharacterized protein LOC128921431 n=1 Tax=Zeugodacus cucurbitae TaxID=28588 RepID=UPI0023D94922|nr:uncharacterized protein LOC128921431 [Zeugodacus cucurbitae]XP_054085123.1 uncharacterized protein LOC128921431 [Zeugodacus cucurbitae]
MKYPQTMNKLSRDIKTIRDTVLKMDSRLNSIENVLANKMPEKSEFLAQSRLLRKYKVLTARTQKTIGRITGDIEDEEYLVLSAKLPMSSEEALSSVATVIQTRFSADALMRLLVKAKGHKGNVDGVLRSLFGDTLINGYNLEGRRESSRC